MALTFLYVLTQILPDDSGLASLPSQCLDAFSKYRKGGEGDFISGAFYVQVSFNNKEIRHLANCSYTIRGDTGLYSVQYVPHSFEGSKWVANELEKNNAVSIESKYIQRTNITAIGFTEAWKDAFNFDFKEFRTKPNNMSFVLVCEPLKDEDGLESISFVIDLEGSLVNGLPADISDAQIAMRSEGMTYSIERYTGILSYIDKSKVTPVMRCSKAAKRLF